MAIDPTIALQYHPPQLESPIDMYSKAMALKSMQGQQQLQQGQIQTNQLENQQRQMSLQSQQALQQQFAQSGGDLDKFRQAASQDPRVLPGDQFKILETMNAYKKSMIDLDQAGFDLQAKHNATIGSIMQNIQAMPDEPTRAAAWPGAVQSLSASGVKLPPQFQQQYPGIDAVKQELNLTVAHSQLLDQANKQRTADAEAAKNTSEADLNKAKFPGAQADSQIQQQKATAMAAFLKDPQSGMATIDTAVPAQQNPQMNAAFKSEFQAAMGRADTEGAKAVLASATEFAGRRSMALDPQIQAAEVKKAGQTAVAEMPARIGEATAIEQARLADENKSKALTTVLQSENAYNQVSNTAGTMKRLLQQAAGGDSTAAMAFKNMLPEFINAQQGIKRLSGGQLEQTPGSALDKLQGWANGITQGQPIPARMAKEAPGVIDEMTAGVAKTHNSLVDSSTKNYGIKADHVAVPGAGIAYKSGGKTYTIPPGMAAEFEKDHPGAVRQ